MPPPHPRHQFSQVDEHTVSNHPSPQDRRTKNSPKTEPSSRTLSRYRVRGSNKKDQIHTNREHTNTNMLQSDPTVGQRPESVDNNCAIKPALRPVCWQQRNRDSEHD